VESAGFPRLLSWKSQRDFSGDQVLGIFQIPEGSPKPQRKVQNEKTVDDSIIPDVEKRLIDKLSSLFK